MERMGKQNIPELLDEIDEDLIHLGIVQAKIAELAGSLMQQSPNESSEQNAGPFEDEENEENEEIEE